MSCQEGTGKLLNGEQSKQQTVAPLAIKGCETGPQSQISIFIEEMNTNILMLADTGSVVTIICANSLSPSLLLEVRERGKRKLKGIDGNPFFTLGSVMLTLVLNGSRYQHMFQVVDKSLDLPSSCQGILGSDFFAANALSTPDQQKRNHTSDNDSG